VDVQDALVKAFNESQTAVVAEAQFQGAYAEVQQKLLAALAAGSVPDLVLLDAPFVALFAKDCAGAWTVRSPKRGLDVNTSFRVQDGYYKGKLYALPFMRSTPLLYFNRDMFAAAACPAPGHRDEFRDFAAR
jgi:sn-glycerol 3-phosphate transport system substrate-binding protein